MEYAPLAGDKKTAGGAPRVIGYADEAAFYLVPSVGLTWARTGQTPVLREGERYGHLSVISLITETGDLRYQIQDSSYQGDDVVRFLRQMRETYPTTLTLIWDGASIHRGEAVKTFCRRKIMASSSWNNCLRIARNSMPMRKNMNCKISAAKRAMNSCLMSLRRSDDSNNSPI